MDKTFLPMSNKELNRYDIVKRLIRGEISEKEASGFMRISIRQTRRLKSSVNQHRAAGLIHGNRGKISNRRIPEKEKEKIIKLLHKHYYDFWPAHASEKLREKHNICRDPKTIRQIMIDEGLWKPRKIKRKEHREWRQRRANFGEMEQFDGSYHEWLEDRLPGKQCLLLSVDDATGFITYAKFDEHEGVFPVFDFWREYIDIHGKPMSIYMDRFSTYSMNHKLAKDNPDTLTQFQRSLGKLHIESILAYSPEAKGRVETMFRTLQNRLVKEMRLKNICTIEKANKYLKEKFIPWYNNKYAISPRGRANLHKKLNKTEKKSIKSIFSKQKTKTVHNDFTISYNKQWYQLTKQQPVTIQKKDKVTVEEYRDGKVKIRLRGKYLNFTPISKGLREHLKKAPQTWFIAAGSNNLGQAVGALSKQIVKEQTQT